MAQKWTFEITARTTVGSAETFEIAARTLLRGQKRSKSLLEPHGYDRNIRNHCSNSPLERNDRKPRSKETIESPERKKQFVRTQLGSNYLGMDFAMCMSMHRFELVYIYMGVSRITNIQEIRKEWPKFKIAIWEQRCRN